MFGKVLTIAFLFPLISYAGQLTSVDFLYSSENVGGIKRNYLEITMEKKGDCSVVPEVKRGKEIVLDLIKCKVSKPYSIGERGNFVKKATLIPDANGSRLVVELRKPGYVEFKELDDKFKFKILEGGFVRPEINAIRTVEGEEVVIDFHSPVNPTFKKVGDRFILTIPSLKLEPGRKKVKYEYVKEVYFSNSPKGGIITLKLSPGVAAVEVLTKENQVFVKLLAKKGTYAKRSGESVKSQGLKIALQFTNADVKSVVKAIAAVANVNVVFDPEVKGNVDVNFKNPVPWKEALKAVLEPLSLTYIETPDYIRVLPKTKIVKEEKLEPVANYVVSVNYVNAEDLVKDIRQLIGSSKREKIAVNKQTNSLLLKVTPDHYKEIIKLLRQIDRPRKQILVKAKIVQLSSKAEKDLGFSWYISGYNRWGEAGSYTTGSYGFNTAGYTPLITPDSIGDFSKIPVMDSTLALGILNRSQTLRVELALKALEVDGEAQVISSPKVLTLDNQEASIEQGIEIPYRESTVGAGGTTSYNINFKKASLILKVRPHVTSDDNILLDLEVRKDSPNYDYVAITGSGEPAINTRNVKSRVLIHNGDTVVIGGIYEKEKNKSESAVPGLSRIPLLGWLFRNTQTTISKTQMVIFITPIIVKSGSTGLEK